MGARCLPKPEAGPLSAKADFPRNQLNPKEIESLPPGKHGDGNNLYLVVKGSGSRAYMLRYSWNGRPQKMGLGSIRDVNLSEARDAAIDANRLIAKGINPREARDEKRYAVGAVLFGEFAEELRLKKEKGFKHPRSQGQVEAHRRCPLQAASQKADRHNRYERRAGSA